MRDFTGLPAPVAHIFKCSLLTFGVAPFRVQKCNSFMAIVIVTCERPDIATVPGSNETDLCRPIKLPGQAS
ncbi:hypothetical protein TWF751_004679 [Orbilia oligospora]|nr:hypothetical protein TWF751_004679 [Orbilia oligospora]